jgi:hypothetical protein
MPATRPEEPAVIVAGTLPDEAQKAADLDYAFCVTREGHDPADVDVVEPEPEVGERGHRACALCGHDLSTYAEVNAGVFA